MHYFLNALTFSMLLFLIAAGMSMIFGILGIINFAHGAFLFYVKRHKNGPLLLYRL